MTEIHHWAKQWGVPPEAVDDLMGRLGAAATVAPGQSPTDTEAGAQVAVRLEASKKGIMLGRNNVGAGKLENGSFLRWGLFNDSYKMNQKIKSADLIGVRLRVITSEMVGGRFGQFVAREVKRPGWKYRGTAEELAQLRFLSLILSMGGDAAFATGEGTL